MYFASRMRLSSLVSLSFRPLLIQEIRERVCKFLVLRLKRDQLLAIHTDCFGFGPQRNLKIFKIFLHAFVHLRFR